MSRQRVHFEAAYAFPLALKLFVRLELKLR
jgi:hypothetical protein